MQLSSLSLILKYIIGCLTTFLLAEVICIGNCDYKPVYAQATMALEVW